RSRGSFLAGTFCFETQMERMKTDAADRKPRKRTDALPLTSFDFAVFFAFFALKKLARAEAARTPLLPKRTSSYFHDFQ
ncbi:MAG: hypothetical protein ACI4P3_05050, partial [Candidatus Spyradosoma sp.]